jgi:chromatin segregation and condensation protein Rec8/ScpA/Scc1 (kleisin family)
MMEWIKAKMAATCPGQTVSSRAWFDEHPRDGAALLLALLEMAAKGALTLCQNRKFGAIGVQFARCKVEDLNSTRTPHSPGVPVG